MKKKIKYLIITVLVFIGTILLINTKSYAGSQKLNRLNYEVQLNSDGSVDVIENWNINISDTNTLFKTFELDSSKYDKITNVSVSDLTGGSEKQFVDTKTYAYHVQKGGFYALNTSRSEFEIAWGVSINGRENRVYQIKYKITDAIKNYKDCSEFYWQFIGNTNGIPADKVTGTILLPSNVSNKENLKVWAHGPLNGEIYAVDSHKVVFEVDYLEAKTMVEVRVLTTENIFTQNLNVVNSEKLNSIIEEETIWADSANRQRDKIRQRQELEEKMTKIVIIGAFVIGIAIFLVFIAIMIKYILELRKIKKIQPEQKLEYFRDFPDEDAAVSEASYLYYFDSKWAFKNNLSKIVSGIMLDLALKKAITFKEGQKNKIGIVINKNIDASKFKSDEQTMYNLLLEVERYANKKDEKEEHMIFMTDIEKYAKKNDRVFLSKLDRLEPNAQLLNEMKNNYDNNQSYLSRKWENKRNAYFITAFISIMFSIFIIPLFISISCLICGIICNMIVKKMRNLTQKGANEAEKWKALKRYMENFSLLKEREVPELVLWEKYLVFATAFGIADKVLKQLKVKYPELLDDNYMINNGYTSMYLINRYNFDRMLTSSMHRAYSAGIQAKAAREAAIAASSYSSRRRRRTAASQEADGGGGRRPDGMGGR